MGRVIRGSNVIPREIIDAKDEAKRLVEAAVSESESIVSDAKAAAESLRAAAASKGREDAAAAAGAILVRAQERREALVRELDSSVGKLALAAAKHIVADELLLGPERVRARVQQVIESAKSARLLTLRVHPDDVGATEFDGVTTVPDDSLHRGDCVLETEAGEFDARIETQLAALAQALSDDE